MVEKIRAFAKRNAISESYIWAGIIVIAIFLWMVSGQFGSDSAQSSVEADASLTGGTEQAVSVRGAELTARDHIQTIIIRGRTEASRTVTVRAETVGRIVSVPIEKGAFVSKGEIICELAIDAREAQLEQAKAAMRQRELEFEAAKQLKSKGHRSETQEAAAEAAFNAAEAAVKEIEVELEHTRIRAPFDGLLDDRPVEIGDFVQKGDACGTLIDQQPFLVTGQLSEAEVAMVQLGSNAEAVLVSGEPHKGVISFISASADPNTRTFRIEMEIPNEDLTLRDGVTAEIRIPSVAVRAHQVLPSSLVLNDAGQLGVRTASENGLVEFHEVSILADNPKGVWVTGLPEEVTVIVVGQEYVSEGQKIKVTLEQSGTQS